MTIYIIMLMLTLAPQLFFDISKSNKAKRAYLILIFAVIAIVSSLRKDSVGTDTRAFCGVYRYISTLGWDQVIHLGYEFGFVVMCKALSYVSADHQMLIIASSCMFSFSFGRFIYKNSLSPVLSVLIFLTFFYPNYLNIMRQVMAISIVLFGIESLKREKYVWFILCCLLASQFHTSAIICVSFPIFTKIRYNTNTFYTFLVVSMVSLLFYHPIAMLATDIIGKYSGYLDFTKGEYKDVIRAAIAICVFIFCILYMRSSYNLPLLTSTTSGGAILSTDFLLFMVSLWMLSSLLGVVLLSLYRMVYYFDCFALIIIPRAISYIRSYRARVMMSIAIGSIFLLFLTVALIVIPLWNNMVPYSFFWEN